MTHHIAERDQPVLDVVVDLAGQVADGCPPFRFAYTGRARAESRSKVAEQPRQPADFVGPGIELDIETIEIEHRRLFGKSSQAPADPRRHPHCEDKREQACSRRGREQPRIGPAQKHPERRQRLSDLQPRLCHLHWTVTSLPDYRDMELADGEVVQGVLSSRSGGQSTPRVIQ